MKSFFQNIAQTIFEQNAWVAYAFICVFSMLTLWLQQTLILTDEVYFNSLGEQLTYDRIEALIDHQKKWAWLSYALVPIMIMIQAFLIAICLDIGIVLRNDKVSFKNLLSMVTKILLIPTVFKVLMVCLISVIYDIHTMKDLTNVISFSLLDIVGATNVPEWAKYPLTTFNIIELIFWLLLAYGMKLLLKIDFGRSISFVGYTYGIGLIVWMVFVVFLQVNFT